VGARHRGLESHAGSRAVFSSIDDGTMGTVRFADGSVVRIEGIGTVLCEFKNGEHRAFTNVYFIPRLITSIISVGQLDEEGYEVLIKCGVMTLRHEDQRLLAKISRSLGKLYRLKLLIVQLVCLYARAGEDAWRWHARFGHINFKSLWEMAAASHVQGMPALEQIDQLCEACLAGKLRCASFPQSVTHRATRSMELLHGDIYGPINPTTPSGNRYFLLLVDDYSRYMWIALLPSKDRAVAAIKHIQAVAEKKSGNSLGALRIDHGGEFTATHFTEYYVELDVRRELTSPYSPQQNGVVEKRNQTVMVVARCMMKAKCLPRIFWGEAVNCVVYLLNRAASKSIEGKTPYELWTGSKPAVNHLRTFGCVAHVKNNTPNLKKLSDRSRKMIFVGYEPGSAAYRCYDPATRKVHISRDVVFDEECVWDWSIDQAAEMSFDFLVAEQETEFFQTTKTRFLNDAVPFVSGAIV
jgi:hypothetical protein